MGVKLSIVVPIFGVEKYLPKCLNSLLAQDLAPEEYELILVDDGSPDGSGDICDEYALSHSNIKVVHRKNGGLSAARNNGIGVAEGNYIQFVDADDYLEPNVLKSLVEKMDVDKLDVLRFNYQNVNEQNGVFEPNKVSKPFVDYRDEVCDGLSFLTIRLGFGCYACQFMSRRELLEGCLFKEGIFFEDSEWTPRLLCKAQKVTSTNRIVYNYLLREGSITQSVDEERKKKVLEDKLLLIDSLIEQKQNVSDKRWFEGMITQTVLSVVGYVCDNYYEERRFYLQELRRRKVFPLSVYHATRRSIRKIRIANMSPEILCHIIHLKANIR